MLKDLSWVQWFQCAWYWNLGWPLGSLRASSTGHSGAGLGKKGEFRSVPLEFEFCLQFPCGSSSTELSDFCQSAGSRNERECKQTLMRHALRVMTALLHCNVISTNQHSRRLFRYRYSNFRDVVASSPSFSCLPPEHPRQLAYKLSSRVQYCHGKSECMYYTVR